MAQLEQLERLRSEIPPMAHDYPYKWFTSVPMSKQDKVKVRNFEMDPTRTIGATELTRDEGRTDGRTDGQTDGQTDGRSETNIPLTTSLFGGYNYLNQWWPYTTPQGQNVSWKKHNFWCVKLKHNQIDYLFHIENWIFGAIQCNIDSPNFWHSNNSTHILICNVGRNVIANCSTCMFFISFESKK